MSKSNSALGKALKGINSLSSTLSATLADDIIEQISSGSIPLTNVYITGGILDGVIIGNDIPGPGFFTTLQTGDVTNGYDVIFYGDTIGESFQWDSTLGLVTISGDLVVSQTVDLGNIRISGNTISSTNVDGNINLTPNGDGTVIISGDLTQSTPNGNISFQTSDGTFSTNINGAITLTSTDNGIDIITQEEQTFTSNNGDIILQSGVSKTITSISFISTGSTPTITTSTDHNLEVGDNLNFLSTNSTPIIDGDFSVTEIVDDTNFKISPGFTITSTGNNGNYTKNTDIYLTASNNINIPYDVKLTFGADSNYIIDTSSPLNEMSIISGADLNLSPSSGNNINIPDDIGLVFGSDTRKIESDGTDLTISSNSLINITSAETVISGNLSANGDNVVIKDPIITLGEITDDNKDRGIEFNYYDSGAKLAWFGRDETDGKFTYYVNATNTLEVISGTLGDAKFADGDFSTINVSGTSTFTGTLDACDISCTGLMTLSGSLGIKLNAPSGQSVIIPQGTLLQFGETGSPITAIFKEASGDDLVIQSQGHIFITPGSTAYDVIIPQNSALVLNGEGGSQKIESNSAIEMTISSSSFLNLTQVSGGVRLTEGLPLIFNQDETTKITGDAMNNMIVNSGNSINLVPDSGQVTLPVDKNIEFGDPLNYIGSSSSSLVLNTEGTFTSTSIGNASIISTSGDILLSPSAAGKHVVILPNKNIELGSPGEYIGSNSTNDLFINSSDSINYTSVNDQTITSTAGNILLAPSSYVNIPYSKPLRFGGADENITGTSGNIAINADDTTVGGNLTVNGTNTTINSTVVVIDDPIITLGETNDDNKDRGVEFNYFDGSSKLGFFGYDDSLDLFTFYTNATNTSEVISGTLGGVKFSSGNFTSIELNDGDITGVDNITSNNDLTLNAGSGQDIILNVDSGQNIIIPPNVDLLFDGEDAKFYSDGVDLHVDVTSPGKFLIDTDTIVDGDLTVTGNISIVGGTTVVHTVQRFTVTGGAASSPNSSANVSFISVSGPSTVAATGIIPAATVDGFIKTIALSSIFTGGSYELTFPTGRLVDPVSGSGVAKKMIFTCPGQSVQLLWDDTLGSYIMTNGGAEVVLA